jgi:hypothetical protein
MTRVTPNHPFRFLVFPVIFVSLLLLGLSLSASTGANPGENPGKRTPPPDLDACQNLQAPAGSKVAFRVYAAGVQIYRWNGTSWVFLFPDAALYSDSEERGFVGTHYAGPTWESNSGSKVVGAALDRCTPDQNSIPWLSLKAVSTEGPGIFHRVTYIQRLNTSGGKAPEEPGDVPGEIAQVPYAAEYYFYRSKKD